MMQTCGFYAFNHVSLDAWTVPSSMLLAPGHFQISSNSSLVTFIFVLIDTILCKFKTNWLLLN